MPASRHLTRSAAIANAVSAMMGTDLPEVVHERSLAAAALPAAAPSSSPASR